MVMTNTSRPVGFKPKNIKVVNRLIFDRIYPSLENPYGLLLVERFIVKEKETDEL